jgi:hypothetical protein
MADWIETDDPAIVASPSGQEVPRALIPPADRVVPAQPTAAPAAPMGAPAAPVAAAPMAGAPQPPLTAQSVLAKLDEPSIAAARGQLPIAQQTTTTQSAVPMSTLKPVMDRGTARAESQAQAVTKLGEQKAQIGEQQAMTAATAAYGHMQQSQAEADQAAQRAEIARLNQIATASQNDPEVDPGRYVRGMTTGQSVMTVILAALEGGFRGINGQTGQNTVISILDKRIDQDIMAQKEQIASGRIRRGNMIAYFREQGMNEEAAEKAARGMAYAQAEKLTQAEIARQGAGMARPEAAALAEQLKAAREQANDELVLTLGTPRSSTSTVRAPAQGGDSMGGFTKMLAAREAYEKAGATPEELAQFDKTNGRDAPAPTGESETARKARLDNAPKKTAEDVKQERTAGSLDNLAKQLDSLPDDTHSRSTEFLGKRVAKGAADVVFGEGAGDVMMSDQEKADRQVFEQAVNNYASLQSVALGQGAMAGPEFERAKAAAFAMGPKQLARAIRSFSTTVGGKPAAGIQAEDR